MEATNHLLWLNWMNELLAGWYIGCCLKSIRGRVSPQEEGPRKGSEYSWGLFFFCCWGITQLVGWWLFSSLLWPQALLYRYTNGPKVIYNNEVRVEKIRFALLFFACSFIYLSRYKMTKKTATIEGGSWYNATGPSVCPSSCPPSLAVVCCHLLLFTLPGDVSHCHQFKV